MKKYSKQLSQWITEHIRTIRIVIILAMLLLALWGLVLGFRYASGHYVGVNTTWGRFFGYFLVNLGPELAGIVIGVVIIDALNDWRQTEQLKAQLIRRMGSPIREVAVPAVRELEHHRWLYDGSLEGANLEAADLKGADLLGANLRGTKLHGANLQEATLIWTHLEKARLVKARLEKAVLQGAHLERARLDSAHLEGAHLVEAILIGAKLKAANLQGANLAMANLQRADLWKATGLTEEQLLSAATTKGATMPDGVKLNDITSRKPNPDDPTLQEWLAASPDCLDWSEEEE